MLVLTRKVGETIHIGGDIQVTIVDIHKGVAKVGIKAPKEIAIDREEVIEKKINNAIRLEWPTMPSPNKKRHVIIKKD